MPDTVKEYSKNAVQSFIQTAVFIDDRIYQEPPTGGTDTINTPSLRAQATDATNNDGRATDATNAANNDGTRATQGDLAGATVSDSYEIVKSFAEKRIVCSMYEPKSGSLDRQMEDIVPLCTTADIVIVDWNLHINKGTAAIEFIKKLINQANQTVPEQLRLILVYTQEQDLAGVTDSVFSAISDAIGDSHGLSRDESGVAFHTVNSRVAVLGKPVRGRDGVNESELATIAIEEFAKLASGILQGATLLGLAEIRNNSRKILSRFNHQLDPAFLTHLAMSKPEEDALSHIVPLLVSEIESVLEDALPRPLMSDNLLKDWCVNVWEPGDHLDQIFTGQRLSDQQVNGLDRKRIATDICEAGFEVARKRHNLGTAGQPKYAIPDLSKARNAIKASKMLLPSNESKANERLAQLMASRTFYGKNKKTLELGCILFRRFDEQYLMCIQPVCDSVRLEDQTVFIFVELKVANAANEHPVSHIIVDGGDNVIKLLYDPKPKSCYTAIFERDSRSKQVVAKEENDELYFEDMDDNKYDWKDQLRTSHAQRAVEQFARYLSRVGLTESEWLRRLGKG